MKHQTVPRLPVFGWAALRGKRATAVPCLLDLPRLLHTTSGRASILLALETLGVGPDDRVLLPTYHCPTMIAPADSLGAEPMFYPIDAHGTPDLRWLEQQPLHGVRVMLAAHYFGLPQPMGRVRQWCSDHRIALIEDCAHALFGRSGERAVGEWGDIAIASLTKFLPVDEGGCLVMNTSARAPLLTAQSTRADLRSAVDILDVGATQGALPGLNRPVTGTLALLRRLRPGPPPKPPVPSVHGAFDDRPMGSETLPTPESIPEHPDGDFTIDARHAHRQLTRPCRWIASGLPRHRIVENRRRNFQRLLQAFRNQSGLRPLFDSLPVDSAPYVFPLWVDWPDPGYIQLRRMGMPVFRWNRLWPGTRGTLEAAPHDQGPRWSHHVLQLACHQDLSDAELERFIAAVLKTFDARPVAPEESPKKPAGCTPANPLSMSTDP